MENPELLKKINDKIRSKLDNLPENPGVYQFKDALNKVIYVGKAKVLKNRVRQYFNSRRQGIKTEKSGFPQRENI